MEDALVDVLISQQGVNHAHAVLLFAIVDRLRGLEFKTFGLEKSIELLEETHDVS